MSHMKAPAGVRFLQRVSACCCPRLQFNREICYRSSVLFLTYIAYMSYHLSRKPISVVKPVLNRNCTPLVPPDGNTPNNSTWCDWAPFDGSDASSLLGILDSSFLMSYAIAMFFSGFIAERVNLRYFLAFGMLFSGLASYLFGVAKSYNIHSLWFFIIVQAFGGICQSSGWPGVVTTMSNWFEKSRRGLIFGIWNSHTSIGNILGSVIAGYYVETDWAYSFIVPGLIIGGIGFLIFLFLVVYPTDVGLPEPRKINQNVFRNLEDRAANIERPNDDSDDEDLITGDNIREVQRRTGERTHLLINNSVKEHRAIGFMDALRIPGVFEFSLSLFFSKLVSYTFLYWLPAFVKASTTMSAQLSAELSTVFDIGGIFGAITAGVISDYSGMSATTCSVMLLMAAPMMFIYQRFCTISLFVNVALLLMVGFLVNGPYALITTAVSAELGTHSSLADNSKALATVTAIIDGTGSIGAAVGPFLTGFVSSYGWSNVFYMLIVSDILALVLLLRLVRQETTRYKQQRRQIRIE